MIRRGERKLAKAMLKPVNPTAIILLGVFTLVWGFWVGNPFWEVFSQAHMYSLLSFAPEWAWGLFAGISGIVICHGAFTRAIGSLILGAKVGGFFWLVVSLLFIAGNWMDPGGITALLLAVYSFFIYLNLKVNRDHCVDDSELFSR